MIYIGDNTRKLRELELQLMFYYRDEKNDNVNDYEDILIQYRTLKKRVEEEQLYRNAY